MNLLVQSFLEDSANRSPNKIALIQDVSRYSYKQVDEQANRLANALLHYGVKRADRIVIHLPNSADLVFSIFAVLKASGIFVTLNATTKQEKLFYILNNCQATVLITSSENRKMSEEALHSVTSLKHVVLCAGEADAKARKNQLLNMRDLLRDFPESRPLCPTIDQDLACLIYTSGSTGEPKGVVCGHNNMVFASGSIITYLKNSPDDIVLNALPLSFDYGLYQLLMAFRFGGTLVLERSFLYPAQILKRIDEEKVTGFPVVPSMVAMMLQMDLNKFNLGSLRYITNTASSLPPQHILELMDRFKNVAIYSMYGLTECKRALYLPPEQLRSHPASVGKAIPGTEVWLEDERRKRLGPGEIGELAIRGSHVMRGYWDAPEATARVFRPGPTPGERTLLSGDLFRMDTNGYLYFLSREDDIIKSRGEKVAPKEIENVLYELEGVAEAAVVGIPDPILGQAIRAYIVVKDKTLTEKDVRRHCSQKLENFMVPQHVEFRASLPKTNSGKISKKDLLQP